MVGWSLDLWSLHVLPAFPQISFQPIVNRWLRENPSNLQPCFLELISPSNRSDFQTPDSAEAGVLRDSPSATSYRTCHFPQLFFFSFFLFCLFFAALSSPVQTCPAPPRLFRLIPTAAMFSPVRDLYSPPASSCLPRRQRPPLLLAFYLLFCSPRPARVIKNNGNGYLCFGQ